MAPKFLCIDFRLLELLNILRSPNSNSKRERYGLDKLKQLIRWTLITPNTLKHAPTASLCSIYAPPSPKLSKYTPINSKILITRRKYVGHNRKRPKGEWGSHYALRSLPTRVEYSSCKRCVIHKRYYFLFSFLLIGWMKMWYN